MILKGTIKCEALRFTDINEELRKFLKGYVFQRMGLGYIEVEYNGEWFTVDKFNWIVRLPDLGVIFAIDAEVDEVDEVLTLDKPQP